MSGFMVWSYGLGQFTERAGFFLARFGSRLPLRLQEDPIEKSLSRRALEDQVQPGIGAVSS
jgi:hypothetical protein